MPAIILNLQRNAVRIASPRFLETTTQRVFNRRSVTTARRMPPAPLALRARPAHLAPAPSGTFVDHSDHWAWPLASMAAVVLLIVAALAVAT